MDNDQELREYILKQLTRSMPPEKIIYDLSQKTGTHWSEIEALVKEVQAESRGTVARKQSPLFMLIAILSFVAGVSLIVGGSAGIYGIIAGAKAATLGVESLATLNAANAVMYLINFGGPFLTMIGFGIAVLVGTVWGLRRMWSDIFSDTEAKHE